jgi:hypothetical protein
VQSPIHSQRPTDAADEAPVAPTVPVEAAEGDPLLEEFIHRVMVPILTQRLLSGISNETA